MFKVILLIVLFNTQSGEITGIWNEQGALPAFETVEQCEEVIKNEVPKAKLPDGLSVYAECIAPSAAKEVKTGIIT